VGRARKLACVALAGVAFALGSFAGCATDYSSLANDAGAGDAPGNADATSAGTDGSSGGDGATANDAADGAGNQGQDAGSTTDANGPCVPAKASFCATSTATLCADYDECGDASIFTAQNPSTAYDIATSTAQSFSAPRSLHVGMSAMDGSILDTQAGTQWMFTAAGAKAPITIDLQFLITALPPVNTAMGPFRLEGGPDTLQFFVTSDACYFQLGPSSYSMTVGPLSVGTWHHVTASITLAPAASTITAGIDGSVLWSDFIMPNVLQTQTALTLTTGLTTYHLGKGEMYVDNVTLVNE
jgi:hypothetical protein